MRVFLMNEEECKRKQILESVNSGVLTVVKAAQLLGLSYSHTKRLWAGFKRKGAISLVSKKRGKKSNRAIPNEIKAQIAEIISNNFKGCKPLYVSEVLNEHYGYKYSSEFIRQLMMEYRLWFPKQKKSTVHQRRERRECEGELVQADASQHDWFEGRLLRDGKPIKAHLHIFIDDATSTIYGGYFDYEETTTGYFNAAKDYFEKRGIPQSLYTDRRGTFLVNQGNSRGGHTQFSRAMEELKVEMIFARSPQAKGRAERTFGTLQERLVWEMRRLNITSLEEANEFLPKYLALHNKKFSVKASSSFDAHRSLDHTQQLKYILCKKEKRGLSKNLEVQYNNKIYQLKFPAEMAKPTRKTNVEVLTTLDGEIHFVCRGHFLNYKIYEEQPFQRDEFISDTVTWEKKKPNKPSKNHPWRKRLNLHLGRICSVISSVLLAFG